MENITQTKTRLAGNWDYWRGQLADKFDELEAELICHNWAGIQVIINARGQSALVCYHHDSIAEPEYIPEGSLTLESGMTFQHEISQHWLKQRANATEHYPYPAWLEALHAGNIHKRVNADLLNQALDYMREHELGLTQGDYELASVDMALYHDEDSELENRQESDKHFKAVKYIRDMWECQICGEQPADFHNEERETRCEKCLLIEARIGSGKCSTCYDKGDLYGENSVCEFHFLEDSRTSNYTICLPCAELGNLVLDGEPHKTHHPQ